MSEKDMLDEKHLLDDIDNKIKSAIGETNAEADEFNYRMTERLDLSNKGKFGIEGTTTVPYPIVYANPSLCFDDNEPDIFKAWFTYFRNDKIPRIYQRWALISLVAALVEKNMYLKEGIDTIFPNIYVALVGDSGTGKTRTILRVLEILRTMGYEKVTTATTTREKFVEDLENGFKPPKKQKKDIKEIFEEDIFGDSSDGLAHAGYIVAEEWKDFFKSSGSGNDEWISLLEKAYDCPATLDNRVKTGKGSRVKDPVVNMLAAVTPDGLNDFTRPKPFTDVPFSGRVFTIYSPAIPKKYSKNMFLDDMELQGNVVDDNSLKFEIINQLNKIIDLKGQVKWAEGVKDLFDYVTSQTVNRHVDTQHTPYYNRRELHLKKLCIIFAAMSGKLEITKEVLCHAEEVLLFAESFLPCAVGFPMYGFADYSSKRIMQLLNRSHLVPTGSVLSKVSAVIPDQDRFEKQKQTLSQANRIKEISLQVKIPGKVNTFLKSYTISKLMDYRLFSVLKSTKDISRPYEYFYSLSEIIKFWESQQDIENILGDLQ